MTSVIQLLGRDFPLKADGFLTGKIHITRGKGICTGPVKTWDKTNTSCSLFVGVKKWYASECNAQCYYFN